MAVAGDVVAQERRRLVHVPHEHVDVAVVVEVAEGAAAAGVDGCDTGPGLLDQLLEAAVAQIAEHQARAERVGNGANAPLR